MRPVPVTRPSDIRSYADATSEWTQDTFAAALTRGIERSDMSLEHLQRRLKAHGVKVSLSTLSYWRRGRTRPERPDSLRAVGILESILGIPPGYLVSLLGPRKPRGRWAARLAVSPQDALLHDAATLSRLMSELDGDGSALTFLSVREQHFIDEHRRDSVTKVHCVVRAEAEDVRGCGVAYRAEPGSSAPTIVATSGCATGRQERAGLSTVSEIHLDRSLRIGQTAAFSYEVRWAVGAPSTRYRRVMRNGTREYLLEVMFHPDALPRACHQVQQRSSHHPELVLDELRLGRFHGAHMLVHTPASAILGIRWTW